MTRGEKNNNPFNLRYSRHIIWAGLANPPMDEEGYCIYQTYSGPNPMFWGLRAGLRDLFVKYSMDGLKTIEQIISQFAPQSENDTERYIKNVCGWTSWKRDQDLVLDAPDNLKKLGFAIIREEQGVGLRFTDEQIDPAVSAAMYSRR